MSELQQRGCKAAAGKLRRLYEFEEVVAQPQPAATPPPLWSGFLWTRISSRLYCEVLHIRCSRERTHAGQTDSPSNWLEVTLPAHGLVGAVKSAAAIPIK